MVAAAGAAFVVNSTEMCKSDALRSLDTTFVPSRCRAAGCTSAWIRNERALG